MNIILAILLGGLFGFALAYAGATEPKNIVKMLRLEDLYLAKVILFAIGLSSVLLSLTSLLGLFDLSHLHIKSMNLGVLIGGLIFGLAFGSIGTCPGTCIGGLGSKGIKKSISAILGGLLGAFTFSLSYGSFKRIGLFETLNFGKLTLFNVSADYSSVFNIGFIGLLIVGILFMLGAYFLPDSIIRE